MYIILTFTIKKIRWKVTKCHILLVSVLVLSNWSARVYMSVYLLSLAHTHETGYSSDKECKV